MLVSFAAHVLKDVGLRPTAFSDPPTQCGDPSPLLRTITPHVTDGDAPRRRRLTTREAMAHPVELPLEASVQPATLANVVAASPSSRPMRSVSFRSFASAKSAFA